MESSDIIAIASVLLSMFALVYSYMSNTKKYELQSSYRNEVLCWYAETNDLLIKLKLEAKQDFPDELYKRQLLSSLSSRIELGRFYFPNIKTDYGADKPLAYQGYRNLILDFLVFSYRLFERNDAKKYLNHAEALQRYFTSQLFEILDPRKFLEETKKHTQKAFTKELSFEDFLDKEPELLMRYIKDYNID